MPLLVTILITAPAAVSGFRRVSVGQHFHFGDRVHVDRRFGRAAARRIAGDSVDIERVVERPCAIHGRRGELPERIAAGAVVDHPGQQLKQRHHVAAARHQVGDLFGIEQTRALGTGGLHLRAFRLHFHAFGNRAHLQTHVTHGQAVRSREVDVFLVQPFEARGANRKSEVPGCTLLNWKSPSAALATFRVSLVA